MDILDKIQQEIKQDYYTQYFSNDGQRFVAWYLRNIHLLDQLQTKDAITDGADDKQIDAVYIDDDEQKIYIIQGKFYVGETVNAEPVREVISSWSQLHDIPSLQQNANYKLQMKLNEIANALQNDGYSICFELITTSTFSDSANDDIIKFQKQLSEDENSNFEAEFVVVDKEGILNNYIRAMEQDNPSLNHTIQLESGKYLVTDLSNTKVIIAALPLKECINIPGIKDGTLFQKNVRQSLGISNAVNKKIRKTILSDKHSDFFFFHNGATAICNKIEDLGNDKFSLHGLSVVNGCQSLNTSMSCSETVKQQNDSYILFRFYEIPQHDRAESISTYTNTQSAVKARDLRSNDKRVLQLKKSYEQKYPNGYFATKRGDSIKADKDKKYCIELSQLGKYLIAWYSQRPNISYGETKIFDKYFDTLFNHDYRPEDLFGLEFWMQKIMSVWTVENPLSINEEILTMKAYAPYHFLFAVSAIFAKLNGNSKVPLPYETVALAEKSNLSDQIISIVANCCNSAYDSEKQKAETSGSDKGFIPQNWIKNKASMTAIQNAVTNYMSFLPSMNAQQNKLLKDGLKMNPKDFEYRLTAD